MDVLQTISNIRKQKSSAVQCHTSQSAHQFEQHPQSMPYHSHPQTFPQPPQQYFTPPIESRNNDNRATVLSDIKLRLASDNVDTPLAPTLVLGMRRYKKRTRDSSS
nr:unnamed protein product [Callosobruchus analis]